MQDPVNITTFYRFAPIHDPAAHQHVLHQRMLALGIRGTLTLAREGVNATLSGEATVLDGFVAEMTQRLGLGALPMKRESNYVAQPFKRTKVKVKPELISLGEAADPAACVGTYVRPQDWNALIARPDLILIDTRNDFEYAMGHFEGAINPGTRSFKDMVAFTRAQLDPASGKAIAMYCTGGIRCEKYSAYLLAQGFSGIYHLQGGILAYLEQIPPEQSRWVGQCFVFDERVALGHGLAAINNE